MISGRRFLSSQRAAKEHGYHSDYIGQLIRGDKVKGQKVGRAWYVDAESLATYLGKPARPDDSGRSGGEISPPPEMESEPEPQKEVEIKKEEIKIKEKDPEEHLIPIAKIERVPEPTIKVSIPRQEKKTGLTYVTDDAPLLPEIRKGQKLSSPPEVVVEEIPVKITSKDTEPSPKAASYFAQGLALALLGVFMLIAVTAASILFVSELKVGTTQSASIHFSLPR